MDHTGIQKATRFVILIEQGKGDSVKEIVDYWGNTDLRPFITESKHGGMKSGLRLDGKRRKSVVIDFYRAPGIGFHQLGEIGF